MRTTTTTIILALLCIFSNVLIGQLSISGVEMASTDGDPPDSDGFSMDTCSSATADASIPVYLSISAADCDCLSGGEGSPIAFTQNYMFISNPPANTFATSSYLGYTIPFGWKMDFNIFNGNDDDVASYDFNFQYGSDDYNFQSSNYVSIPSGNSQESFNAEENLILPKGQSYHEIEFTLAGSTCPDPIAVDVSGTAYHILLPSQFYTDNAIVPPTTETISGQVFAVETVCAENMYLENVILDSYHYASSNDLILHSEIVNSANVSVSAGNSITLAADFYVDASSNFSTVAYVGCTP